MRLKLTLTAAAVLLSAAAGIAGEAAFTEKPSAKKAGDDVKISFAVAAPVDVEVAVLDAKSKTVRHLAAGMLGDNSPSPFAKGLKQEIVWDGRDDAGKPAKGGPFSVRVALGAKARLDRIYGWSGQWLASLCGMATGPDGMLYVVHRGNWLPHRHTWLISAFGRDGKYDHQVFPGPANLPPEKRKGWPWVKLDDPAREGEEVPVVAHLLTRSSYPAALLHRRVFPVITSDGRLIAVSGGIAGLRADQPDIRGGRRLLVLGVDGSVPGNFMGPVVAPADYGGFAHLALTPDEKHVYMAGLFAPPKKNAAPGAEQGPCHVIWKIALDGSGKPEVFAGTPFKPGAGKAGLNEPQGLAVDKVGRLYVADYGNDRVAVFSPDGKFLDEFKVKSPDQVKVSRATGAVYVLRVHKRTRGMDDPHWYSPAHSWRLAGLAKFDGLANKKLLASLDYQDGDKHGGGAFLALDDSGDRPRAYVGGLVWCDSAIHVVNEDGGKLELGELVAGRSGRSVDPAGDMGFSGDLAYASGKLYTSGPSSWGFKGNQWASFDADTGEFAGTWSTGKIDKKFGKIWGHGELVSGKDGRFYCQSMNGLLSRFEADGKPAPFASLGSPVITDLHHGHSRQTGLFADLVGKIYIPVGKGNREIDPLKVKVIGPDGKTLNECALEIQATRTAGMAVDREGNIYISAQVVPEKSLLPAWIAGKPLDEISGKNSVLAYRQCASIFKFPSSGGAILRDANGTYEARSHSKPARVAVKNALWVRRAGLVPAKGVGCYCETTRFDIDEYGRLLVPDTLRFSVVMLDGAGNEVTRIGSYGNMDSRGPGSPVPDPEIAFAWPLSTRCGGGRIFVADPVNCRMTGVRFEYAAEAECPVK